MHPQAGLVHWLGEQSRHDVGVHLEHHHRQLTYKKGRAYRSIPQIGCETCHCHVHATGLNAKLELLLLSPFSGMRPRGHTASPGARAAASGWLHSQRCLPPGSHDTLTESGRTITTAESMVRDFVII